MESNDHKLTLRDLLYVLFKHRFALLFFAFSSLLAGTLYSYIKSPAYEATSRIVIQFESPNALARTSEAGIPGAITTMTHSQIITSEIASIGGRQACEEIMAALGDLLLNPPKPVPETFWQKLKHRIKHYGNRVFDSIDSALCRLGLKKELSPREKVLLALEKNLSVEDIKNSNSVVVRFRSPYPGLAAEIVNKAVSLYQKRRLEFQRPSGALDFFTAQTALFKQRLDQAERELRDFKDRQGLTSLEEQRDHLLKLHGDIRGEIHTTDAELARLREQVATVRNRWQQSDVACPDGEITKPSDVIDSLKLRLVELQSKRIDLLRQYQPDSRFIVSIDEEIESVTNELEKQKIESAVSVDVAALEAKKRELTKLLDELNAELKRINELDHDLHQLTRTVDQTEEVYGEYYRRTEEVRMSQAMDAANITNVEVAEYAYPPILPVRVISFIPQRIFNILMSLVIGVFAGVSVVAVMEMCNRSFRSPEDIEACLDLAVLGSVPEHKRLKRKGVIPLAQSGQHQ